MKENLPYQLICSDIDGTLLDVNRDLSHETLEAFTKLGGNLPIVLASSRMPSAMHYLQEKLGISGAPLIAYNGGLILGEDGVVIESNAFNISVLNTVISHRADHYYNVSIYSNDDWFTAREDYWTQREMHNTRVDPTLLSLEKTTKYLTKNDQLVHKIMCMGEEAEIDNLVT
ncbi:MAG: HAD-IIB family hydrolase, partial [Leeuwenhoekiella sp.]